MSLLAHDLKIRSSGSSGRELLERLDTYCLDLLGTNSPLAFAQALQIPEPRNREVLEELLEWTPLDNDFLLIALVALRPELELVALRLSWGRPGHDTIAEVLVQATEALHWTNELVEGERADFVLAHTLTKTRTAQRWSSRHNVITTFIRDDYDVGEPDTEVLEPTPDVVALAVANRVISDYDARLIRVTRGGTESLESFAELTGVSYVTIRKRRSRAEDDLRRFVRAMGLRR